MATPTDSKIIPLFPRAGADDAMRELSLARRRGFDADDVPRAATPRTAAAPQPDGAAGILSASRLSSRFIESLDDMMRGTPVSAPVADWPQRRDAALEKVAADIVDMLFGFVLDHPQLPSGIRQALLRAQLPVLRMAMQETAFFSDWRHPARKLLGAIAPALQALRARHGDEALFERCFVAALDRILDDLTPNGAAFATLHETLDRLVAETPAEKRGNDSDAWERAEAISRDILARPLPQLARVFLADCWIDVLQRTALAHPEDSPQWRDAVQLVEDLAWSLAPKHNHDERLRLIGMIPALLGRLNRGLDLIGLSRDERRPFFDALVEAHAVVLRADPAPAATAAESAIDQVMRLKRGDWAEFIASDGSSQRARLSWISPQRGILVFTSHQGERAIQIAPDALAEQLAANRATLIFDQPDEAAGKHSA